MLKIGITGGIGSGKTYVARLLEQRGIPVYSTDAEAKRLMVASQDIRAGLTALAGEVYRADGSLDKERLAAFLFASPLHVEKVNAIVHPVVRQDFLQWVARQSAPVVAMECAILYESGFDSLVDDVLLVRAPEEICLSRAMKRDGATTAQVKARMAAQMKDAERLSRTRYIICNDGKTDVESALDNVLSQMLGRTLEQD